MARADRAVNIETSRIELVHLGFRMLSDAPVA
jgi:hypothetical protein